MVGGMSHSIKHESAKLPDGIMVETMLGISKQSPLQVRRKLIEDDSSIA